MTATVRAIRDEVGAALAQATVGAVLDGAVRCDPGGREARVAVQGYVARVGDEVLLAQGADGAWVIGVVETAGPRAERTPEGGLAVRDVDGALLFEHDPATGRSVVRVAKGGLEIRSEEGDITLASGASTFAVSPDGVRVVTGRLDARARVAEVSAAEGRAVFKTLHTAVEAARHLAGVVEIHATRIVERAKDTYREAEGLSQTRAGRVRMIAASTFHVLGRRTLIKATDDVKLKGDKIHLG